LADVDGPVELYGRGPGVQALRWLEESGPIEHAWRYGAEACNAADTSRNSSSSTSSYAAVDSVLDRLLYDRVRFPSLERIVVAGHSAGGQFTQRWALLSNHPAFDSGTIKLRTVVANPKSYCYLDARRFVKTGGGDKEAAEEFRVPDDEAVAKCPSYNEWEWGLDGGSFLPTPYKDASIAAAGGRDAVVQRYASRDVAYLSGELDVVPNGYYCMERVQGKNRLMRGERFYESLRIVYGGRRVHRRLVVRGVHHDHALMFQSPEGREAMFGDGAAGVGGLGARHPPSRGGESVSGALAS
jgi:pimeloyl-ACP methyl ester carboxylesterase